MPVAGFDSAVDLVKLLEQAPGFVAYLHGKELVFQLANAAYYQLVGHREIIGRPVRDALPEVREQGFFELLEQVVQTGQPFVGRQLPIMLQRTPDGALVAAVLDFIYQPIRDDAGAVVGILAQGHDVTEASRQAQQRELAEQALRASEERYRTLFDSIDDGYCLLEMLYDGAGQCVDYRFLEANAAFVTQSGLRDAVGKRVKELVPELDASWFALYGRVADTGEPARFENHAPAMQRWFDVFANRVGEPAQRRVALVFKDITARKAVEAAAASALERERAARQDAEAAGRLRDEFLATVSHELRTPLASILGWAQMLRSGSLTEQKRERALETIERNARAQAQLIEDLLDVSRILSGQMRIDVGPVDVRSVVDTALETVRPAAIARDIRIQATLATDAVVMGDAHRLQQVVWNLLSNAVKFTPRSGRVQITVAQRESSVEIIVADTGKGIDAEFLPFVFDRFRQAEGTTTRKFGGLGLGLSIVRELVAAHGGTVQAFSDGADQGATFTVRLPLSVARRREATPPRGTPNRGVAAQLVCPPELAGVHVLVVDDEPDTREMLRALLETCGVRVTSAGSVAEALAAIDQEAPDIVLSDIGMPGADGYSLVKAIRELPARADGRVVSAVPAIALTAYARTEDRALALHAGFDNHMTKPVEPLELLAVLASFARRARRPGG